MRLRVPAVYILASQRNGTLYVGVTSDLVQRAWQHRSDIVEGFTKLYRVHTLVHYEMHGTMESAIRREKQLKHWNRDWKLRLIEQGNPEWKDLWAEVLGETEVPMSRAIPAPVASAAPPGSPPARG